MTDVLARADEEQFLADFRASAEFGRTDKNGVDRRAGSEAHGALRDWFQCLAEDAGFTVHTDQIGNIFALKEWIPGADYVVVGSHLDSQAKAGPYDGGYGVIAAFHAALATDRTIEAETITPRFNIAVVDFFNEEGARFHPSMMGSAVYTGHAKAEKALAAVDPDTGLAVAEVLQATGRGGTSPVPITPVAYAEIHNEQGRRLEDSGTPVGVVDRNWWARTIPITVEGEQSHAGGLMEDRRDALAATAEVLLAAERLPGILGDQRNICTISRLDIEPNVPGALAREVRFTIDMRAEDKADLDRGREILREQLGQLAASRPVEIHWGQEGVREQQTFRPEAIELAESAAAAHGFSTMRLGSRIGHDALWMTTIVPSVLLFMPSVDGISHAEREYSTDQHMLGGLKTLTTVTQELVTGALVQSAS